MEINNNTKVLPNTTSKTEVEEGHKAPLSIATPAVENKSTETNLKLSDTTRTIHQIAKTLINSPQEIDHERVAQVKAELKNGTLLAVSNPLESAARITQILMESTDQD